MEAIFSFLWTRTPGPIKWSIVFILLFILLPVRVYEGAKSFVHQEVWAIITPLKEKRELELFQFRTKLDETANDVKDIRNYLLYGEKPEQEK